jgi:hypothetical protein
MGGLLKYNLLFNLNDHKVTLEYNEKLDQLEHLEQTE